MRKKNENRPPMIQAAVTTMFHHVLSIYDPFGRCGLRLRSSGCNACSALPLGRVISLTVAAR